METLNPVNAPPAPARLAVSVVLYTYLQHISPDLPVAPPDRFRPRRPIRAGSFHCREGKTPGLRATRCLPLAGLPSSLRCARRPYVGGSIAS